MMSHHRNLERRLGILALAWLLLQSAPAQTNVILHLKNGDRIAGTMVREDTNSVVVATDWIKELAVPQSAIKSRAQVSPVVAASATTNLAVAPPPVATVSNLPAAKPATAPVIAKAPPPTKPAAPKHWKANVDVGADLAFGAVDRQLYWSRLKFTYELPYKHEPKKFFRSNFDYAVDYGQTAGKISANRMDGGIKIDFDVGRRLFVYSQAGVGFDEIRKIDLHYEVGPGMGYHLFTLPKFVMNVESGMNYQVQNRTGSRDVESFYLRLAEDMAWKISPRVTFTEKYEFFPNVENFDQFRFRLDSSLRFRVWENLSVNLTVLDLYDTNPGRNVARNELQIRSSLGISF